MAITCCWSRRATALPLRYFTGAGWNRSGQFADRASWESVREGIRGRGGAIR